MLSEEEMAQEIFLRTVTAVHPGYIGHPETDTRTGTTDVGSYQAVSDAEDHELRHYAEMAYRAAKIFWEVAQRH